MSHLGNDHQGRGAISLDIELDAPQGLEGHREGDPLARSNHEAAIGHGENGVCGLCADVELFPGFECSRT